MRRDEPNSLHHIPLKANFVLNVILCILFLIGLRIWHLAVIQHEKKVEEAFQSRRRTWVEPAARGTIRDRFNTLLAANICEYRLSIVYSQFRDIQSVVFEKMSDGSKSKRYLRREYIKKLSSLIGEIIQADPERVEDIIHSHAALNNNIPLVIKKGLTEEEYFRLKLLEKDWQGLVVQCVPKRYYPRQRQASDVIGYLGPISKERYTSIISEMRQISEYVHRREKGEEVDLPEGVTSFTEAKMRLMELSQLSYSINDSVGLVGIEASFEKELRGYAGRRAFFSDAKGNALRELPGSVPPAPGKRVLLSLSIELQEFAERLLAQADYDRELAYMHDKKHKKAKEPIVRGGAIVAMDPNSGELLALASFPRFDPNDFIRTKGSFFSEEDSNQVLRWLENDVYLGKVWDGIIPLMRERYNNKTHAFVDVEEMLTWERFLELALPIDSPLLEQLASHVPIKQVIGIQRNSTENNLLLDFSRLILLQNDFSSTLIDRIGDMSIGEYRALSQCFARATEQLKSEVKHRFHESFFIPWRKENEKEFLKKMRLQEKQNKISPRPYLDYIEKEEASQFEQFWQEMRLNIIRVYLQTCTDHPLSIAISKLPAHEKLEFLRTFREFRDLTLPLVGSYRHLCAQDKIPTLQDLATSFIKGYGVASTRSFAFRHSAVQGSLFKLVTAYAGLKQRFMELKGACTRKDFALFEIIDHTYKHQGKNYVGNFPSGQSIPQIYKSGRIPKSLYPDLGRMDLLKAIELSSNPYFSLLAGDYLKDPMQLHLAATDFGFGQRTKVDIPFEQRGFVPVDIATSRTGLYSMAIGQHTLLTTPLQTAVMLSAIANGGKVITPRIVNLIAGKPHPLESLDLPQGQDFPYKESLKLIGLDFPLFSKSASDELKNEIVRPTTYEPREIFMPPKIQGTLLEGLNLVIQHIHHDRTGALGRLRTSHPESYAAFMELKSQLIGKTSTAESQEKIGLDVGQSSQMYNHTWFGGISYHEKPHTFYFSDDAGKPELVVVVYLRYGGYGREAAPLAAQIVKKWRDIRATNEN